MTPDKKIPDYWNLATPMLALSTYNKINMKERRPKIVNQQESEKDRILIIEDDRGFRELLKIFLSRKYVVNTAENGLEAFLMLKNGYMPDVIISDYVMPLIDGKTFVIQIKSSNLFKHIPIIVMSSIARSAAKIDLIQSGASDYLVKPFGLSELGLRIEKILKVVNV